MSQTRGLSPEQLKLVSQRTVGHYQQSALAFWEGTKDHDVTQNIDALLRNIRGQAPYTVLDFGCGPGRDLLQFQQLGHHPVGLDGAAAFVEMARARAGCTVLHQDFLALELPAAHFDGVFANATLFHVPRQELPRVLGALRDALKPGGVLFSSNPRGDNVEGWNGARYGAYHDLAGWSAVMIGAGFEAVEHYYRPAGKPRHEQPWLASVWRKPGAAE